MVYRNVCHHPISNHKIPDVASAVQKMGIGESDVVIFSNPNEIREDLVETIRLFSPFLRPLSLECYNLVSYPQSASTEQAIKDGCIFDKSQESLETVQGAANSPTVNIWAIIGGHYYTAACGWTGQRVLQQESHVAGIQIHSSGGGQSIFQVGGHLEPMARTLLTKFNVWFQVIKGKWIAFREGVRIVYA
jgi:hypothetical protein